MFQTIFPYLCLPKKILILNTLMLVIIVLAISLDAFTALFLNRFLKTANFRIVVINIAMISIMATLFAVTGAFVGKQFDYFFSGMGTGLASGLFLMLGLKMMAKSLKPRVDEMNFELENPKMIVFYAIALSMNAFILAIALPAFKIGVLQVFLSFIFIFLFSSIAAVFTGRITDNFKIAMRFEFAGGIILTGSAVYYLIKLFGIIS